MITCVFAPMINVSSRKLIVSFDDLTRRIFDVGSLVNAMTSRSGNKLPLAKSHTQARELRKSK